jgi:hypothetical protein
VLVLAFVVLVTGLIVAFFSRSLVGRQVSNSSANQTNASVLAQSAVDIIIANLRQEIANGSTLSSSNNITIYTPSTAANMLPVRSGNPSPDTIANMVRRSVRSDTIASPGVSSSASAVSSTDASLNGRSISTASWNGHYLIPRSDKGASVDATPNASANFTPPDWVIVTRAGPKAFTGWDSSLSDRTPTNTGYAVGRYAYAIYDEGGLLDMNAAGYPSGLTATQIGQKGTLALADLTQLFPSMTSAQAQPLIDNIVGWRNYATAQPGGYFGNFTFTAASSSNWLSQFALSNTTGYVTVSGSVAESGQTDQAFLSRQQLIKLLLTATANAAACQDALQYMGTFTRALNAPSYTPSSTRATTQSGQGYRISPDPGNLDDQFNPSLINQRVPASVTGTRDDGTNFVSGEPLIKHRFPLGRLALIAGAPGMAATATASGTDPIYKYFGLTRSSTSSPWVYNHGDSARILKLSDVAAAGREPDFFELLQAGITVGSLGKIFPSSLRSGMTSPMDTYYSNIYFQIFQIGLDMIDQYGSGSYPTALSFNGNNFYGVKNLPYIARIFDGFYRFTGSAVVTPTNSYYANSTPPVAITSFTCNRPNVGGWCHPELWNPHQNADSPAAPAPTQFRIYATGTCQINVLQTDSLPQKGECYFTGTMTDSNALEFPASADYKDPQLLTPARVSNGNTSNYSKVTENGQNFVGLYIGQVTAPAWDLNTAYMDANYAATDGTNAGKLAPALYHVGWGKLIPSPSVNFYLQYKDSGNNWVTYSQIENHSNYTSYSTGSSTATTGNNFTTYNVTRNSACFRLVADPRTGRFGMPSSYIGSSPRTGASSGTTVRPTYANDGYGCSVSSGSAAGWTRDPSSTPWAGMVFQGDLTQNTGTQSTHYADPDGVQRWGDAAYASTDLGQPLTTSNYTSRPVMLNRAFQSVAEMGYAFRDTPWKSIDFFTANSGDAALLDLFCLNEDPADSAIAGTVNLNTRQPVVLKALLSGATKNALYPSTAALSSSEISSLATSIITVTGSAPLVNRSEIATRIEPVLAYSATADSTIKAQRETVARALSDVGDTRTWNLLIDIVVQSGRYPSSATKLAQFQVEGERHIWLHVAIDRFTGSVISQSLEPVYD